MSDTTVKVVDYEYLSQRSKDFVEAIKRVENNYTIAKRRGEYKQINGSSEWRWFPGASPEGGLPTLAWGHKLTQKEWAEKKVTFFDETLKQHVSKNFNYGLTDEQVTYLLMDDLKTSEDLARSDWNKYIGWDQKRPFEGLPDKYKGVLINLTFNAGALAKKGKFVWTTVAKGILANDDVTVTKGMVTSYKRPDGVRVRLTTRAVEIAKGLGLPWQALQ
jgi:hypothetical protein